MAPFAVCARVECGFAFDYEESDSGESKPSQVPPPACPSCGTRLVTHCPKCFWSIEHIPTSRASSCPNCGQMLFACDAEPERRNAGGQSHEVAPPCEVGESSEHTGREHGFK